MDKDSGNKEFASLDEVAGVKKPEGAWLLTEQIRSLFVDFTDLSVTEPAVAAPIALRPGQAMVLTIMDTDGTEYEVFVRMRQN